MGVGYYLVNATKREQVGFLHIGASTARELSGNPAASAVTTWYLLQNAGDEIHFVSDTDGDWPFASCTEQTARDFPDVTDQVIQALLDNEVLADHGTLYSDPSDPDRLFLRDLRNAWMPDDAK